MRRYLPPSGTAGFDRMWVSGKEPRAASAAEDEREHVVHGFILIAVPKRSSNLSAWFFSVLQ